MPRKEVKFYCDKCGTSCGTETTAEICESKHLSVRQVTPKYSADDRKNEYPTTLLVTLENRKVIEYFREKGYRS